MVIKMETKKLNVIEANNVYVYWHKSANSGLSRFNYMIDAHEWATKLTTHEDVYDVVVIDLNNKQEIKVKGDER